jgi:hypothetical protein
LPSAAAGCRAPIMRGATAPSVALTNINHIEIGGIDSRPILNPISETA